MPAAPSLEQIAEALFSKLEEGSTSPDAARSALQSLHFLFERNLVKALQIVDKGGVTQFAAETSGRELFQVKGRGPSDQYIVFPGHYCSCHSFFWDVVSRKHAIYCKHQLAARAAQATRRCPISRIPDDILARMLMAA